MIWASGDWTSQECPGLLQGKKSLLEGVIRAFGELAPQLTFTYVCLLKLSFWSDQSSMQATWYDDPPFTKHMRVYGLQNCPNTTVANSPIQDEKTKNEQYQVTCPKVTSYKGLCPKAGTLCREQVGWLLEPQKGK